MTPNPQDAERGAELRERNETERTMPDDMPEPIEPEQRRRTILESVRAAYRRARDGRNKYAQPVTSPDRHSKSMDRSKAFLALAAAVVVVIFVFLGMFSSSSGTGKDAVRKSTPNLGRPEGLAGTAQQNAGSLAPLQNADLANQGSGTDQISPDDIRNTARLRAHAATVPPAKTLASVPPMDPALEAYRAQADRINQDRASPPPQAASVPANPNLENTRAATEPLKKASLVFVRQTRSSSIPSRASVQAQPALLEPRRPLLPNGTRLVARLQAAVSTAVKTPVVATVEYSYEKDGEIVVPAGTKVFGELQQASRNGSVGLRFHTLQMPDGVTEQITASAMALNFGPVKGQVSGSNRSKRILVRSLTGVGTIAAYMVGGRGGLSGLSGPLDNSILLRERIAQNAGVAGEQELMTLAMNEQIVVTVPGNTRFFIVLEDAASSARGGATRRVTTRDEADAKVGLPSPTELRELIELKAELNRLHREVGPAARIGLPGGTAEVPEEQK